MNLSPVLKQLFVASAPQMAAISAGAIVSFPSVLLPQLNSNNSTIQLDIHTTSWIGSTHGLAGVVACLVPFLMQSKGRKLPFILSCLTGIIGWIIVYFAQSAITLIVAEAFHGLGSNSLLTVSLITISEMVHPRFRIISMNMYILGQALGMTSMALIGRYCSWKTAVLIECCPIILALLIGLTWPESPAWLAYKGDFDGCEKSFKWLRGTDADALKELNLLIRNQKEKQSQRKERMYIKMDKTFLGSVWLKISQRDFYLPFLHMYVLLCSVYWSGFYVVLIYTIDMLKQATGSESTASIGVIIIYSLLLLGNSIGQVFFKYCDTKTVILSGGTGVVFFMLLACIVSYLQEIKVLPLDSHFCMYCLIGYSVSFNLGMSSCIPPFSIELMPIKHRGLGGALFILVVSLLDFTSLKISPYLFVYIKLWGTFLVYTINALLCMLFIWRFVPETKNRSLQEIEEFYNHGKFIKHAVDDNVLEIMNSEH